MNWLITGGCGFIGTSIITDLLAEGGHHVRVLDNLSTGTRADLANVGHFTERQTTDDPADWENNITLLRGDILDAKAVQWALTGADVVIHLAANTGVPQSVEDPVTDCKTNVFGVLTLLEGCRKAKVDRFVFASSGAPLGVQTPPLHEEMSAHPASPYGASKLAGEGYCSAYYHCYGVETVTLRFGNIYGEGSLHKGSVVAKFIKQALAGERLEIYGDGNQTRDYIHISDLVAAIRAAASVAGIGGETFQIATASETSLLEIVAALFTAMRAEGLELPATYHGEKRMGDVERNFSDTSKARRILGWAPKLSLEDGLRRTIRYFQGLDDQPKVGD